MTKSFLLGRVRLKRMTIEVSSILTCKLNTVKSTDTNHFIFNLVFYRTVMINFKEKLHL